MPKRALITGITGQDGGHLAELLHKKGYEVFGIIRGQQNPKKILVEREQPYVKLIEGDLTDPSSLLRAMKMAKPDEVYNLAAISHVGYSFKTPQLVADITGKGVLNMLEAIRESGGEKPYAFIRRLHQKCSVVLTIIVREKVMTKNRSFTPVVLTA
jgi:GDPmannose 4,6-dehydratase